MRQKLISVLSSIAKGSFGQCCGCGRWRPLGHFGTDKLTSVRPGGNWSRISTGSRFFATASAPVEDTDTLTPVEEARILKVINEVRRSEDLLGYVIPKKKAEELVKTKNERGTREISTLDEVISIIGPKSSSKFFCSILDKPIPISVNSVMFPVISSDNIRRISKVLSLILVGDKISWVVMNRTKVNDTEVRLSITDWNQTSYAFKPRMHFLTLLKEMTTVAEQIPESQLCILEEYPSTSPNPHMFNFHLQMAQARSMLLGILNSRSNPPMMSSAKTVSVARMFNTFVGSEKVSGQYLVEDMVLHKKLKCFDVSEKTVHEFCSADSKVKEGLSQAFLVNLAYWKVTRQILI